MDRLPQVLLVDDERGIRLTLQRILVSAGFDPVAVASGEEALAAIREGKHFDVILSDLVMPDMHGSELVRIVRSLDANVPIIVLTGHCDAQRTTELFAIGVSACLDKPVSVDVLIETLRRVIVARSGNWPISKLGLVGG
jgi:CheY-like chemotaxis protein